MRHDSMLPVEDTADFESAQRGFVAALEPGVVRDAAGDVVWDNDSGGRVICGILAQLTPELYFDALAIQVDGPRRGISTLPSAGRSRTGARRTARP